jgi:hypothetical protein
VRPCCNDATTRSVTPSGCNISSHCVAFCAGDPGHQLQRWLAVARQSPWYIPPNHGVIPYVVLDRVEPRLAFYALPFACNPVWLVAIHHQRSELVATAIWTFHGQNGTVRPEQMNFGEWLCGEIPPEKLFQIEADCRRVESHPDAGKLAGQLLKQVYHQQEMLQRAVNEIARLECELM